ncbi:MAG: O-antigen ligase family protein, partial [Candidatus Omnitrophica bacterium]|nr:O-antigen ligase family protein [Candidatus Omnitrophota bacterium]
SMQDRLYMWRVGWKIFLEHPIIGSGVNTFFLKFKEFREDEDKGERGSYAHNGYLQLAAETGMLGLSIFLLLIGRAFFYVFKYISGNLTLFYKSFTLGLAAGLLAFLIHSFFDTNLQSLPLITLFWFSLAVLMGLTNYARER